MEGGVCRKKGRHSKILRPRTSQISGGGIGEEGHEEEVPDGQLHTEGLWIWEHNTPHLL